MRRSEPLWRRYLRFFGADPKADVDDELSFHLQELERGFLAQGMSAAEARRAARAQFGDVAGVRRSLHRRRRIWLSWQRLTDWAGGAGADLRMAVRHLRAQPAFALAVVGVLAVGTGATTAMFSAVDATMLRPLPFTHPDRLAVLEGVLLHVRHDASSQGHPIDAFDATRLHDIFTSVATYIEAPAGLDLNDPTRAVRLKTSIVTASFFRTLGVTAAHGRTFIDADAGATSVVVLSDDCWRQDFGGAPMLGHIISLNRRAYTVVGIMPPGFAFPHRSDVWIPMAVVPSPRIFDAVQGQVLSSVTIGRLRPGVPMDVARTRMKAAWHGQAGAKAAGWIPRQPLQGLQASLGYGDRRPMLVLLGATVLLLLLACANVANLQLSRAATRAREIAVRAALGGTRRRIVRQLFAESALLAAAGAVGGLLLAPASFGLVRQLLPRSLADVAPARLDARVLGFAALLVALTAIVSGLWPAFRASRTDPHEALKAGSTGVAAGATSRRVRRVLAVVEVALAVMLVTGAGLMLRSLGRLLAVSTGFRPDHVATMAVTFVPAEIDAPYSARQVGERALLDALTRQLHGVPGILAIGAVDVLPMTFGGIGVSLSVGAPPMPMRVGAAAPTPSTPNTGHREFASIIRADTGYRRAAGFSVLRGRWFTAGDDSVKPGVIVISRMAADSLWPGVDPIGRTVDAAYLGKRVVIGVVADVQEFSLTERGSQAYVPLDEGIPSTVSLVVRGAVPDDQLVAALRAAMRRVDPSLPPYDVRMLSTLFDDHLAPRRVQTVLITLFGALALVLAAVGVYAVMAYGVARRLHEFGIRAALGASRGALVLEVAREGLMLTFVGIAIGLAGAWGATRLLASLLYGVSTTDAATYAVAALVLGAAASAASLLPARRAATVDPAVALRAD